MRRGILRSTYLVYCLLLLSALLLASCGGDDGGKTSATPTGTKQSGGGSTNSETPVAGVQLGAQACPTTVNSPSFWDPVVPSQAGVNKVEKVICANLMGIPDLQALVMVRSLDGHVLDIYVYNGLTKPTPTRVFELKNLFGNNAQARISGRNSVATAEVNTTPVGGTKAKFDAVPDIFREFKWSDSVGTLVPVVFPGIYPMTRYEALNIQDDVNKGNNTWYLDAKRVAQMFVSNPAFLLNWSEETSTAIVSGGGQKDAEAEVTVKGGATLKLSMQRLEGNTNGGIWVITDVKTDGLEITAPVSQDHLVSPVTVSGKGNGSVTILGNDYVSLVDQPGTLNGPVKYTSTFRNGKEEGLVVLYTGSATNASALTVVKVLLTYTAQQT